MGSALVSKYCVKDLVLENIFTLPVRSYSDYLAQCTIHRDCDGHMNVSPLGDLMFPGTLCTVIGNVKDDFYTRGHRLLTSSASHRGEKYKADMAELMLTKRGILRGRCCGGNIEGSLRMVIIPCWDVPSNTICIPRYVADSLLVPSTSRSGRTASVTIHYAKVEEGDFAIVVRPPTLWYGNAQPMIVKFWDRTCLGFPPENCGEYHADFDGDEVQLYFVKDPYSVAECSNWEMCTRPSFDYKTIGEHVPVQCESVRENFMAHTTFCFEELLSGIEVSPAMRSAKVKEDNLGMCVRILGEESSIESFYEASISGMIDIMTQQLSQGEVGRIGRAARTGAMDFMGYCSEYGCIINDNTETDVDTESTDPGLPALRLVSKVGALIQQALLDAHRAKVESAERMNLAMDMLSGTGNITILGKSLQIDSIWHMQVGDIYLSVLSERSSWDVKGIIGTFSVKVLASVRNKRRRRECALRGIRFLLNYYGEVASEAEVGATADMLLYQCEVSGLPVTTGPGCDVRSLRWITKALSQHWGRVKYMKESLGNVYEVLTLGEACIFGNFLTLPSTLGRQVSTHEIFYTANTTDREHRTQGS